MVDLAKMRWKTRVVIVGQNPHLVTAFALLVARLLRYTVLVDYFLPLVERSVFDMRLHERRSVVHLLLRSYEWLLCRLSSLVLVDTAAHARMLATDTHCRLTRFVCCLPSAQVESYFDADEGKLGEVDLGEMPLIEPCLLWVGWGHQGFHGVEQIRQIVDLVLTDRPRTRVVMVGPEDRLKEQWSEHLQISFVGVVETDQMAELLSEAAVVLGTFGDSPKGDRVVPFKYLDAAVAGKPYVTAHSEAIREHLGSDAVIGVSHRPEDVAGRIVSLLDHPQGARELGQRARQAYWEEAASPVAARRLAEALRSRCDR